MHLFEKTIERLPATVDSSITWHHAYASKVSAEYLKHHHILHVLTLEHFFFLIHITIISTTSTIRESSTNTMHMQFPKVLLFP